MSGAAALVREVAAAVALAVAPALASPTDCTALLADGRAALERGDVVTARTLLGRAVERDAACGSEGSGLAGDWLGRAWLADADTARARAAWERTLSALSEETWARGGDQLVGRYLEVLVAAGEGGSPAAAVAFDLLMRPTTGGALSREPYWRFLAQLSSVVPDTVRAAAFVDGDWRAGVAPGGGRRLAAWWVYHDPYPATVPNERVAEHLARVTRALRDYPDPSAPTGYDDRGTLLVRFGPPSYAGQIQYNDARFATALARLSTGVSRQSFPANEIWVYDDLDESMVYILVQSGNVYRLGRSEDLLPAQLRNVIAATGRSSANYVAAIQSMRYIYDELATTSMEYGNAWSEVEDVIAGTGSPVRGGSGVAMSIQRTLSVQERERERVREEREPPSQSTVYDDAPRVPFAADAARFLAPDGSTRLDLWWQLLPAGGGLDGAGVVVGSVVRDPRSLGRATETVVVQAVTRDQARGRSDVAPAEASVTCHQPCAPAVQLDLHAAGRDGTRLGPRLRTSVWRVDPREPLRSSGLEMSDLKPIASVRDEPLASPAVEPGTQLSVYFEGYGLVAEPGPARVTVEYEVVLRRRGSLLRRTVETPRSGQLRLVRRGATTEQYLLLATADWAEADEVDVTVRLRDERAGAAVERTRTFYVLRGRAGT